MIEAVNSTIASSSILRQPAEAQSGQRAPVSAPESVREAPRAPFISPFISVDVNFDTAVIQLRDAGTGDVITQIPSESRLSADQRQQLAEERAREAELAQPQANEQAAISSRNVQAPEVNIQEPQPQQTAQSQQVTQAIVAFESAAQTSAGSTESVSVLA